MMNEIELSVRKDLTVLAGNLFGKKLYDEQVKDKYDFSKHLKIIIPDRIKDISSSFIQGFFDGIIKKIGLDGIKEKIHIESSIPNIKEYILSQLIY